MAECLANLYEALQHRKGGGREGKGEGNKKREREGRGERRWGEGRLNSKVVYSNLPQLTPPPSPHPTSKGRHHCETACGLPYFCSLRKIYWYLRMDVMEADSLSCAVVSNIVLLVPSYDRLTKADSFSPESVYVKSSLFSVSIFLSFYLGCLLVMLIHHVR